MLSFLAAGWPLRRALFEETWSLPSYLWFYVRLVVAIYGFWLLLMAAPWLTTGANRWLAALLIGAALIFWNVQNTALFRLIMRTEPITSQSLLDRFRAVMAKASVPEPRAEFVDMRGGVLVNAVALPDPTQPAVVFTSTMLERLDEDEAAAIFGHEVAHLEHFNAAYLKKFFWIGVAFVVPAVTIAPLLSTYAPQYLRVIWGWPLVCLSYIIILSQSRQRQETDSDLRAVVLSGDPEALVRGLVKGHALGKMPRRLDPNIEATASHPSLARRIQAIRAAANIPAATLETPVAMASESASVTFDPDHLVWKEGDESSYSLAYSSLNELRIEANNKGAARLIASDAQERRWTMPLAAEDVARAQAALDIVDARLRASPASAPALARTVGTLVALLCVVAAAGAGQWAAAMVGVLATFCFERPLVRAASVAGLTGGVLSLRGEPEREMAWILLLSAALLLFVSRHDRRVAVSKLTWRLATVIGVFAVIMTVPLALAGSGILPLHQAARDWPAAAVLALAFATATWSRAPRWRAVAAAATVVGGAGLMLGFPQTLDALLRDPFLADAAAPVRTPLRGNPISEFTLEFSPTALLLSPDAGAVAAVEEDDGEQYSFHVGRPGGSLTAMPADSGVFIDERRILLATETRSDTRLQLIDVDQPSMPYWQHTLNLSGASLAIDRAGTTWQVLGRSSDAVYVRVSGPLDGGPFTTQQFRFDAANRLGAHLPLASDAQRLLIATTTYGGTRAFDWFGAWAYWLVRMRSHTRFTSIDAGGSSPLFESTLDVRCQPSTFMDEGPICSASDGKRVQLARVSLADGAVTPLAAFRDAMNFDIDRDWATGWWRMPFAFHLPSGTFLTVEYHRRGDAAIPLLMAASDRAVAVMWSDDATTVRLYREPPAAQGSSMR